MPAIELMPNMETPRALRNLAFGVSLGDVARGTGISHSHLSRIFNGRRNPSLMTALIVANFLNVSVDDLTLRLQEAKATQSRVSQMPSKLQVAA